MKVQFCFVLFLVIISCTKKFGYEEFKHSLIEIETLYIDSNCCHYHDAEERMLIDINETIEKTGKEQITTFLQSKGLDNDSLGSKVLLNVLCKIKTFNYQSIDQLTKDQLDNILGLSIKEVNYRHSGIESYTERAR